MIDIFNLKDTVHKQLESPEQTEKKAVDVIREFKLKNYLLNSVKFYKNNLTRLRIEILSGLTVVLMQIPDSVAFSFVANVQPLVGLYATFFMGFITAVLGGTPAMISGAAGAMAVVAKDLMTEDGVLKDYSYNERLEQHLMCVIFIGVFQLVCGFLQLANTIRLIPTSAMIGFMNGLGSIIFISQFSVYKKCTNKTVKLHMNCASKDLEYMKLSEGQTWITLVYVFFTMAVIHFLPKLGKVAKQLPAAMIGIVICTLFEQLINRPLIGSDVRIVKQTADISGDFPSFHFPDMPSNANWSVIIQYGVILCFVGLIESVMTLEAVDIITKRKPSQFKANQECVAQGLANFICGFFKAMGGDAMIGQSTINVQNGAQGRLSGIIAGWAMLVVVLIGHKLIGLIPIGTLTGALYMVVVNTFYFRSFPLIILRQIPPLDSIIIIVVTVLSIFTNLAIGVIAGVIINALAYTLTQTHSFRIDKYILTNNTNNSITVYQCHGSLFFGCQRQFINMIQIQDDSDSVLLDFTNSDVKDMSAIHAIQGICQRYVDAKKSVFIVNIDHFSKDRLVRARSIAGKVQFADQQFFDSFQEQQVVNLLSQSNHNANQNGHQNENQNGHQNQNQNGNQNGHQNGNQNEQHQLINNYIQQDNVNSDVSDKNHADLEENRQEILVKQKGVKSSQIN